MSDDRILSVGKQSATRSKGLKKQNKITAFHQEKESQTQRPVKKTKKLLHYAYCHDKMYMKGGINL